MVLLTINTDQNTVLFASEAAKYYRPVVTKFTMNDTNLTVLIVGGDGMSESKRSKNGLKSQGCKLAKLETMGSEMVPFMKDETLNCSEKAKQENWIFVDNDGKLRKRADRNLSICFLTYFDYKTDMENTEEKPVLMVEGQMMEQDFVKVNCTMQNRTWTGLIMSWKEEVVKKAKENAKGLESGVDRLSVAMFGFDSMSQQHFRRKMPNSVKQLEEMGTVIMNGYNIVGDGTPQAFIPILTGKTELELPNTRSRFPNASKVDDVYPFIWKNFSDAGYATLYGEDAFTVGTFTYRLKGFNKRPTDHYARPFYKEVEKTNAKWSETHCFGSEPAHKSWFRYGKEFLREYKGIDRFLVMHQGALSHDSINLIGVSDADLAASLASMEKEGLLDDVVLILMADHGHRFTKIRDTHQGQLEEVGLMKMFMGTVWDGLLYVKLAHGKRLPFFAVRLPPKFVETDLGKKMQANLVANKDRLTTPFDVYTTFMDILQLPKDVETEQKRNKRSLSMLRPIPFDRNCDEVSQQK